MELGWDKSRILEVYLNIVEFGPGIYGAEAAARHYFGKPAARLTRYEASLLAAALPNPLALPGQAPSPYVQQRSAWIRRQMGQPRSGHPEPGTRGRLASSRARRVAPRWPPTTLPVQR